MERAKISREPETPEGRNPGEGKILNYATLSATRFQASSFTELQLKMQTGHFRAAVPSSAPNIYITIAVIGDTRRSSFPDPVTSQSVSSQDACPEGQPGLPRGPAVAAI